MTLTEFLSARIAEDEAVAQAAIADDLGADEGFENQYDRLVGTYSRPLDFVPRFAEDAARMITTFAVPRRVLAECEAKRQIVERFAWTDDLKYLDGDSFNGYATLCDLALPYADHPDYRDEWRP